MRFWVLGMAAAVTLTGCIFGEDEEPVVQGSTTCDPTAFEFLIGQDKGALDGVTTPEMVRVMQENSPATTDFHENRLNVVHDVDGTITMVSCG